MIRVEQQGHVDTPGVLEPPGLTGRRPTNGDDVAAARELFNGTVDLGDELLTGETPEVSDQDYRQRVGGMLAQGHLIAIGVGEGDVCQVHRCHSFFHEDGNAGCWAVVPRLSAQAVVQR
jgi:hypothetical protein